MSGPASSSVAQLWTAVSSGEYSLMRGGPTYRLLMALLRIAPVRAPSLVLTSLVLIVSFVPALAFAQRDGMALGGWVDVPLLEDWYVMARFVVALPLLVLGAAPSDRLLRGAIRQFVAGHVVGRNAREDFAAAMREAARWRDSWLPEALCLVVAVAPVFLPGWISSVSGAVGARTDWLHGASGAPTAAAVWVGNVSAPLFRFVLLLWLWRLSLWTWLLLRFARMDLDLRASHPDGAGGVAFLGLAQSRFAVLSASGGFLVCGYCLNQMLYAEQTIHGLRYLIAGYAIGTTAAMLAPLLLLIPALVRTKRAGLERYGRLGYEAIAAFETNWRLSGDAGADKGSGLIDSPHPSAVADFISVYTSVKAMSIVPVTYQNVVRLALSALLPFAPLAFFAMSLDELAQRIFSILV